MFLLACAFESPTETGETGFDLPETSPDVEETETAAESASDSAEESQPESESETEEETDTGGGEDTGGAVNDPEWADGIRFIDEDIDSFADQGYVLTTYEIGPDYRVSLETPDGLSPAFQVLWPAAPDATRTYEAVLLLHGGALGVVGGYNEEACSQGWAATQGYRNVLSSAFARLLAEESRIVVAPQNPYCDAWTGMGPDDAVNPDQAGHIVAQAAYNFVKLGQGDVDVNARYGAILASSFGAPGAVWYANQETIGSVVVDSGFTDAVRFYEEEDYSPVALADRQQILDNVTGGPPTEDGKPGRFYRTYEQMSLYQGVEVGLFTTDVFHLWNSEDPISTAVQHEDLAGLFSSVYEPAGLRYLEWDVAHTTPDHGQTQDLGAFYTAWAAFQFVDAKQVFVFEAEAAEDDLVGSVIHARDDIASFSDASGRESDASDGSGVLTRFDAGAPASGAQVGVAFFIEVADTKDRNAVAATLRLYEDGVEIDSAEINERTASWNGTDFGARYDMLRTQRFSFRAGGGTLTGEVEVNGTGTVKADLVVVSY